MSEVENSEILKEQVGISSTISAAEEESKENFDRESIKLDGKEAGEGFLDLTNGNYGFTHTDTESMGEVLDVQIAHIFDSRNKASEQEEVKLKNGAIVKLNKGGLGEGFRTNYNQFLVKDTTGITANDEVSERFIYVDGKGDKHIFEEKYFYKDGNGKKNYVQKGEITIDMDKNLWHEEDGTKYEVEKEVTDGNLKLVAKLEGITGLENIDTDIEEIAQVKSQIKEIQEYIASCQTQIKFNTRNLSLIEGSKDLSDKQTLMQEQALDGERSDLDVQCVSHIAHKQYDDAVKNFDTNYGEKFDGDKQIAKVAIDSAERFVRETGYVSIWGMNYHDFDESGEMDNYYALWADLEKDSNGNIDWDKALGQETDSHIERQIKANKINKEFIAISKGLNGEQYDIQKDKLDYENKQLLAKAQEYAVMLEKKIQELKELERQVPVHYLVDNNGNFMGFGKTKVGEVRKVEYDENYNPTITEPQESNVYRLIVIGDNYENTIFISYDEKVEYNGIIAITHSNNKQIDFEYEKGKLVKIINFDGKETKFKYDMDNKLTQISNGDEVSTFTYNNNGDLVSVSDNNSDGLKLNFSGEVISGIADTTQYSFVDNNTIDIDKGEILTYNNVNIVFNGMSTTLTDEKGNVKAYTFNKKGETLSAVTINSKNVELQKEFNYIGEKCTFSASPNLFATEYVEQGDIALENGIAVKELLLETITAINNSKAKEFVFSAFAKGDSAVVERTCSMHEKADVSDTPKFELRAEISYTGETEVQEQYCSFDWKNTRKQYLAFPVSLDKNKTLAGIRLIFDYSNNSGEATIEDMSFKEGTWVHKTLNDDKLVTEVKTSNGEVETLTYDKKRLVKSILVKDNETKTAAFEYNKYGELVRATDYNGIVIEKEFNANGELIKTSKYNKADPVTRFVEEIVLDEKGRETVVLNEFGEVVENNSVSCISAGNDVMGISSAVDGEDNKNILSYTLGMLTKVSHNGFDWGYTYDHKKRLTKVDLCGETYLTKAYEEVENLDKITTILANGEKFIESLDTDGNVTKVEYENEGVTETLVENEYNDFGKLTKTTENDVVTNVTYDKFGNAIQTSGTQNKKAFVVSGEYDKDKVTQKSIKIGEELKTTNFAYDSQDRLNKVELPNGKEQTLTYDGLGRVKTESIGDISKSVSYVKKGERTCNLVSSVKYARKGMTSGITKYTYDKLGNIVKVEQNGTIINRYEYDTIGRLTREDNRPLNKTITYVYDCAGNIVSRKEHLFTLVNSEKLEEITCILKKEENKNVSWDSPKITDLEYDYSYKTNGNNDQILEYCGKKFEYDKIGNPVVYVDKVLKFTKGRQLVEIKDTPKKVKFTYNANGLRKSKIEENIQTGNTFITDYYLDGKNVVREERSRKYDNGTLEGGKTLVRTINYTYGVNGVVGFSIKNDTDTLAKEYLYIKNIQGDIIGIVDIQGNEIAKYDYSAFGKQKVSYKQNGVWVEITSEAYNDDKNYAVAVANPFRYRGYYFDQETNLYYLRSRYYDAETSRFVTIDDISYIDEETINGINLYAYCGNNPVMFVDPNGKFFGLFALILGAVALVGLGLTIGGVVSDNNIMTAIGLTMVAIPALISGGMGLACFGAWGTMVIGGITMLAGVGTGLFASAEYQEIFTGNNWMSRVLGEDLYNGLMLTTVAIATAGTIASMAGVVKYRNFGNVNWLNGWKEMRHHYLKHGMKEMKFGNIYQYTNSARDIITNGNYVVQRNAYAMLIKGKKVAFVGVGQGNTLITTYYYRTLTIKKLIEYGLIAL